MTTQVQVFRGG